MPGKRILILGGTCDARVLASALIAEGFAAVTSLAGVTEQPLLPEGEVRRGGFGGTEGLVGYLKREGVSAVADATHPFAARISAHADLACRAVGLPLMRLERPPWQPTAADRWSMARCIAEAALLVPEGARVLLTIGRKDIQPFLVREDVSGVARMIEPPAVELPPRWRLLLARPPFSRAPELQMMRDHAITCLVTKNAGGSATEAKLVAARDLQIPVIMVQRPLKPAAQSFASAGELAAAAKQLLSP